MSASPTSSLSSSARRALRAAAHHLDPVVMMGQHGLTPAVLHEIDLALTAHALIKVRAGSDEREIRDGYLAEICEKLSCESVQHLGKLFVLWRNADGAGNADKSAEQDAAAVKASNDPHAAKERGPRSKLPSERAAERASAAPAARSGGYAARGGPPTGGRGAPSGGRGAASGGRDTAAGPRWRYGETPPDAPRREGWAPKDRRGAARFGATEGGDDSRRRDGPPSYDAPRGRAPATGGGGYAGSSGSAGGGEGYRGGAATGGRSGYGGNSGGGGSSYGGAGGGSSYGGRGGSSSYGGGQGDGAPRARWGERREPSQGGGGGGGYGNSGGNSGGGFGSDRGAPAPRSSYSRGNDAGGSDRAPRTGGGGGGWGNRDGVTGKPTGFSRGGGGAGGGAGGAGSGSGGAAPRARRRFG